jgi:DNA-binding winged helix-turn-helix (wHTH) protein
MTVAEQKTSPLRVRGIYRVAEHRIDAVHHRLYRGQEQLTDDERTVEFLWLLIRDYPRTVGKDELLETLWPRVVVTEWSLSRLVSDTRQLLRDNGEEQELIRTVRGNGFKLLQEPTLEADPLSIRSFPSAEMPSAAANHGSSQSMPLSKRMWLVGFAAVALVASALVWRNVTEHRAQVALHKAKTSSLYAAMQQLHSYQEMSLTAFKAQVARRDDLATAIEKRLHITRNEEFEAFFSKYFQQLNADERFAFDQIRALTTGHLREANQGLLDELQRHPELAQTVPALTKLRKHLVFWLSKYHSTFVTRADMCVLYGGVEDGVPYPSEADKDVADWLDTHSTTVDVIRSK